MFFKLIHNLLKKLKKTSNEYYMKRFLSINFEKILNLLKKILKNTSSKSDKLEPSRYTLTYSIPYYTPTVTKRLL